MFLSGLAPCMVHAWLPVIFGGAKTSHLQVSCRERRSLSGWGRALLGSQSCLEGVLSPSSEPGLALQAPGDPTLNTTKVQCREIEVLQEDDSSLKSLCISRSNLKYKADCVRLRTGAKINGELFSFQECSLAQIALQKNNYLRYFS